MSYDIQKWQEDEKALALERQRMNEALARLGQSGITETRGGARLLVGLDATSSREPGLKEARVAMAAMFDAIKAIGPVAVKLVYFRGREVKASGWEHNPDVVSRAMQKLSCRAGYTNWAKVLRLALSEKQALSGVVLIGDACEEDSGELTELAAALGEKGVPVFALHDYAGRDTEAVEAAGPVFERLAEVSGGAYCQFGTVTAVLALRELLSTVAAFSVAGSEGLKQVEPATTLEARQLQSRLLLLGPGGGKP